MNKVKVTHSFIIDGGKHCGKCRFLDGFINNCRAFGEYLIEDETSDFKHERCDKCIAVGTPIEGSEQSGN